MHRWDLPQNVALERDILVIGAPGSGYESVYAALKKASYNVHLLGECGLRASALFPHQWLINTDQLWSRRSASWQPTTVWCGTADNFETVLFLPWKAIVFLDPPDSVLLERINQYRGSGLIQAAPLDAISETLLIHAERLRHVLSHNGFVKRRRVNIVQMTTQSIDEVCSIVQRLIVDRTRVSLMYPADLIARLIFRADAGIGHYRVEGYLNPETEEKRICVIPSGSHEKRVILVKKVFADGSYYYKLSDASYASQLSSWNTRLPIDGAISAEEVSRALSLFSLFLSAAEKIGDEGRCYLNGKSRARTKNTELLVTGSFENGLLKSSFIPPYHLFGMKLGNVSNDGTVSVKVVEADSGIASDIIHKRTVGAAELTGPNEAVTRALDKFQWTLERFVAGLIPGEAR